MPAVGPGRFNRRLVSLGPLLLLLVLLLVVSTRSELRSVSARSWQQVQPKTSPTSIRSATSLLACLRHCLQLPPADGCAALYYDPVLARCGLHNPAACDDGGGGLRDIQFRPEARYVELKPVAPRPLGPNCPWPADSEDRCSQLCSEPEPEAVTEPEPEAVTESEQEPESETEEGKEGEVEEVVGGSGEWTLFGHQLPPSVDVWTVGNIWGALWKQVTYQQCQIEINATSSDGMVIDVATAADTGTVKLSFNLMQTALLIKDVDGGESHTTLFFDEPLLQPPALTPLRLSWCSGQVRVTVETSTGEQTINVNMTLPDDLQFVELQSYSGAVGHWQLSPHLVDPWMTSEQGWTAERVYHVPAVSALWRRIPDGPVTNIAVRFSCASSGRCHVFFKEHFHLPLMIEVIISDLAYVSLVDPGNNRHTFPVHSAELLDPIDFRQFYVVFNYHTVLLYDYPNNTARLVFSQSLTDDSLFAPPPQRVEYVGLGALTHPASYRVFEYDPGWGQEQGFTAGAGLLTEQEGRDLMSPVA